jgi:hypothetical protein
MKTLALCLCLVFVLALAGCASVNRSQSIDTDQLSGFAAGRFQENVKGSSGSFALAGGGGGWGSSGGGAGGGAVSVTSNIPPSGAYDFARAVAMINYSKKLTRIKYDEGYGIIEYEFDQKPLSSKIDYQAPGGKLPSAFGHQPVE